MCCYIIHRRIKVTPKPCSHIKMPMTSCKTISMIHVASVGDQHIWDADVSVLYAVCFCTYDNDKEIKADKQPVCELSFFFGGSGKFQPPSKRVSFWSTVFLFRWLFCYYVFIDEQNYFCHLVLGNFYSVGCPGIAAIPETEQKEVTSWQLL